MNDMLKLLEKSRLLDQIYLETSVCGKAWFFTTIWAFHDFLLISVDSYTNLGKIYYFLKYRLQIVYDPEDGQKATTNLGCNIHITYDSPCDVEML